MPMGNGTGPEGMGPRTGRGAGFCNGYDMPGAYNRGGFNRGAGRRFNRGGGRGFGGGMGRGYGFNTAPMQNFPAADRDEMLKNEAEYLEKRLKEVREQLEKESE